MTRPLRVLHCPMLVGGNSAQLAKSERALGLDSWAVSFRRSPYGYPCDEVLWPDSMPGVMRELGRWSLLWRALNDFDVVHFNFGTPILATPAPPGSSRKPAPLRAAHDIYRRIVGFKDLALLRRFGKAIFVTYQGDDARQADYCLANYTISPAHEVGQDYYPPGSDGQKRSDIARFDRHADGIYALNPDLLHVLPRRARFLPYGHIDLAAWQPGPRRPGNRERLRVIHAPSHQGAKGTRHVIDAVNRLKSEGVDFDFTLIEQLSNADARKIYEEADLVVDQLLAGWYGGLAVECMALGKPVICYVREEDLRFVEPEMRSQLPVIRAEPGTIYHVLKDYLASKRFRLAEIGASGRAYVERWHDPMRIARFLRDAYVSALQNAGQRSANATS
ncbi:MAG TPA: glycosyltransferase family 1 protein [Burkholderiales bacterium]|nr:glycosyltransferase family 1 protein [Burkholderiales bacterium]